MMPCEQAIGVLKKVWKTKELKFFAEFHRPKKKDGTIIKPRYGITPYGFFRNFSVNDRKVFYPAHETLQYDRNITFQVNVVEGLVDGKYYYVELELEDEERRIDNPYALKIKDVFILEEDYLPPKEFIGKWFYKKGHTPGDAATIAAQLSLNELELYTHTKRFIFELIQNADDMPFGKNEVSIRIQLLKDHLLFLHNGKFFDREDVKAISDAARTTKSKNLAQTGYKGIGFKSVFTDSSRVYIKSGDYCFKFDKQEPLYKDFHALYKGYYENLTPKAKKDFEVEFRGREHEFTNIDRIPWQIKPIWVEFNEFPHELKNSDFSKRHQVAIALEIAESIMWQKDYHGMISSLMRESRFLLFLRNTSSLEYKLLNPASDPVDINVSVKKYNENISVFLNNQPVSTYIKQDYTININNDDFVRAGLNFQKRELENGKYEFYDTDGRKLQNIPEKLGMLDKTTISLAAQVDNSKIQNLDSTDSILFNYLPTSDQRFGFPFLVNADFVSKTDREFIQIENMWNHYIFYHLGKVCLHWISVLGGITFKNNGETHFLYAKTYLNLLPKELLDEENKELSSINSSFNRGIKSALKSTNFIIDSTGKLNSTASIIIDDTGVAKIFGNSFFKKISGSNKELPCFFIDDHVLRKDYLNIERFTADILITQLQESYKQEILVNALSGLNDEHYKIFLKWLDQFYHENDADQNWLLSLPIIRTSQAVISIMECITQSDYIIRTEKTEYIEGILKKMGFELSEFSLDEEAFRHIKQQIFTLDFYLKNDVWLYDHIIACNNFLSLTPTEKNTLISFFKDLNGVGSDKYAKKLPLFKSKKTEDNLRPLNCLISNSCYELPAWLTDFQIDEQDEIALSALFQKELLKETDFLECLFCNTETFQEITAGINQDNIADFYSYILQLKKLLPEDERIYCSDIPWVFVEKTSSFVLPSNVYWPDSLAKLEESKYLNVKMVLENLTEETLPHYKALPLKTAFALGVKNATLSVIITKTNSFDVIPLNDFLEWVTIEGEKDFFSEFIIVKETDCYSISKANASLQYYASDDNLIDLIKQASINSNLVLLPKQIYSNTLKNIGLLENTELLKHIIKNGQNLQTLAVFIKRANIAELSLQYLEALPILNIDSRNEYNNQNNEFIILKLATQYLVAEEEKLENFRKKIQIDQKPLLERAISDDIRFYKEGASTIELKTKLKEILKDYADQTYSISKTIQQFIEFGENQNLYKVFKAKSKPVGRIFLELNDLKPEYYDPAQTFFLSFFKAQNPGKDVFTNKVLFANAQADNPARFEKEMHLFLDICFKENYTGFVVQRLVSDFEPSDIILNQDFAIDAEKLPDWLDSWLRIGDTESKKSFLKHMGVNDDESSVVLFRKAILANHIESINKNIELIENNSQLINTLHWLANQQIKAELVLKKDVLQRLYQRLNLKNVGVSDLLFPRLIRFQEDSYSLETVDLEDELHLIHEGWGENKLSIFNTLSNSSKITDDVLPKRYLDLWKVVEANTSIEPDMNKLNNSEPFIEEYYQKWELKNKYPIFVYKGTQLPYLVKYQSLIIHRINDKLVDYINNAYYLVQTVKDNIFEYLAQIPQFNELQSLRAQKQKFDELLNKEKWKVKFTQEEIQVLSKLFGNDIPPEFYKSLNLASLITGLIYLNENGFDVAEAENNLRFSHQKAELVPIYMTDRELELTVMARSAKSGLLYMTARAWNRLDDEQTWLFVTTGKNDSDRRLFKCKQDVLDVSKTTFQVFRVQAESNKDNTDAILNGSFDPGKIWLLFKMKDDNVYKPIFDAGIRRNEENPDIDDVSIEEDD